jgi:hypothetical protein
MSGEDAEELALDHLQLFKSNASQTEDYMCSIG